MTNMEALKRIIEIAESVIYDTSRVNLELCSKELDQQALKKINGIWSIVKSLSQ